MNSEIKQLIGNFPLQSVMEQFNIYGYKEMIVTIPKPNIFLPVGKHSHDSYEFFIPSGDLNCIIDSITQVVCKDQMLPLNPGQIHGLSESIEGIHFVSIMMDKLFISTTARSLFGQKEVVFKNDSITMEGNIYTLIRMFIEEAIQMQSGYQFILQNLTNQILINVFRLTCNNLPLPLFEVVRNEKKPMEKAVEIIKERYLSEFTLDDISREVGLHPLYFIRAFKSFTGKTPYDYFMEYKIERAKELLLLKHLKVTDVCFLCGFNNHSHFSAAFKKRVGCAPMEYRKHRLL
ncbi:MAG: hypothetical protein K0R31_351 [Clostridiales bacterium]|jgi:AraC-like DNA-binding protein|nr:hypothetical protein [Clostridiales bacterium]